MDIKEKVRAYLKENHLPREFLCARYGVSLSAVNKWLSNQRPIPKSVETDFENLLKEQEKIQVQSKKVISLRIEEKKYNQLEQEAIKIGLTLSEFLLVQGMKGLGMDDSEISEIITNYKKN